MQSLVDDLLTYSRIGTEGATFSHCDCNDIVDRAITQVLVEGESPGATLTRSELPTVLGDPPQLLLLFRNLLANAVKFRAEKIPRVDVSARESGDQWIFSVKDNGIGIVPASADAIFEMFTRLHPEYPGTGLGLAMARRVVERHHGRIWVESEAGQGSTFSFAIPRSGERHP
jgi:signal transduction histidine kinase